MRYLDKIPSNSNGLCACQHSFRGTVAKDLTFLFIYSLNRYTGPEISKALRVYVPCEVRAISNMLKSTLGAHVQSWDSCQ